MKKEGTKRGSGTTKKVAPGDSKTATKSGAAAPRWQPSIPPSTGGGVALGAPGSLADHLEKRLEHNAHLFEEAKKRFEEAARARVATHAASEDHHIQRDLTEFALEMRLLTARRSELLWVQQVLGAAKS